MNYRSVTTSRRAFADVGHYSKVDANNGGVDSVVRLEWRSELGSAALSALKEVSCHHAVDDVVWDVKKY